MEKDFGRDVSAKLSFRSSLVPLTILNHSKNSIRVSVCVFVTTTVMVSAVRFYADL